ncbi:MAG: RdgB/HAM1 family non-canonical purine NTP pyrophosphatase [Chloroflexi bacterium]|nr:RdgB/HAM1 family non-canonical purine NTP pyrophosphatase [Chloroflexota bacterium]
MTCSGKILLASNNPGKLEEMHALLDDLGLELLTPGRLGLDLEVEESGQTYAENAALKARAFAHASGMLTLADDSGLEVDALGGQPGIRSARYLARLGASDADRRAYLLERLRPHPRPWTARFRCAIALASPGGELRFAHGECPGEIIPEERGTNGFGYDAIFLVGGRSQTMAELPSEEKNRLSHRARAIQAIRPLLTDLIGSPPQALP